MRLLNDRVAIRQLSAERKIGTIVIPEAAQEKPQQGVVVAVGPGRLNKDGTRSEMWLKPGDKVLLGKYAGATITVDGDDLLVMYQNEIEAVIE